MTFKSGVAISLGLVLGFAALGFILSGLEGVHADVLLALAIGCGVSVFVLWTASLGSRP